MSQFPAQSHLWFSNERHYNLSLGGDSFVTNSNCHSNDLPTRDLMIGGWRKLHNENIHSLQYSPNIIRMIKSRSMKWAGHVGCMEKDWDAYGVLK
jgi:hypothetical protein